MRKRPLQPRAWIFLGLASVAVAIVAVLAGTFNQAYLSYDSHKLVLYGRQIGITQAIPWEPVGAWGSFLLVSHSVMEPLGIRFLFGLAPMFGLSTTFLFVAFARAQLRERSNGWRTWSLLAVMTLSMVITWLYGFHLVYIHTNMPSAMFLLAFVGLFWLAEQDGDSGACTIAFIMLLCFGLLRLEAPLMACVFLVLTIGTTELPKRVWLGPLLVFSTLLTSWLLVLARNLPETSQFLTQKQGYVLAAAVMVCSFGVVALHWRLLARFRKYVPLAASLVAALGVAAAFVLKPNHMFACAKAMYINMFDNYAWDRAWWLLPLGWGLARLMPRHKRLPATISYGPWLVIALVFLLGYARVPYREGATDSASRIVLNAFPIMFLFLSQRFIPLAQKRES
jgi:hypothetical protein